MKFRSGMSPFAALASAVLLVTACSGGDGPDAGTVFFSQTGYNVSESAGSITISVLRAGKFATEAGVDYTVTAGSAVSGVDFTPASGTLTWAVGDADAKTFNIPITNNQVIEGNKTFTVTLSNERLADLAEPSSAAVTIIEDDRVADSFAVTGNTLISFDRATPSSVANTIAIGVPSGETIVGIDVRPATGELYALTSAAKLYVVTPGTGAAALKSTLVADPTDTTSPYNGLSGSNFGVDFNPVPDRLRVVTDTGQNLRINVDTGAVITDGAINGAATGYTAAAYTNNFAAACRTALYVLDSATDRLLLQNPPNNGTAVVVGALGVDATQVHGFDIVTDSAGVNTALAGLTVNGQASLYSINLTTGAATALSPFSSTSIISGLAFPVVAGARPQTAGDLVGLTESGKLVTFNQAAPAKLCTSTAISGLGTGESVVGIDTRPSDGQVYALSSASKVYTLNKATAAATLKSTLSTPISGTDFGIDFNPVPDRLRVVSDSGQNLRIDVDSGMTTVDTALSSASTGVAYTNSLKGGNAATLTTTTYYLDSTNNRLLTSTNPNGGVLTAVGSGLGIDITGVNGFDINGINNTALIAVNVSGTATTLHTLDLVTGLPSASLGTVGGGERLRGLTAFAPPATATVFGVNAAGQLVSFSPATPGAVTTVGTLSGLNGGETVTGLDFRPSTGRLYALTSAGRLYTVDPATAVLTAPVTLVSDATDLTLPFTSIGTDAAYGLDFNPTGPVALRVVSSSGQNLRVGNPDVGNTFTDTNLAYGAFGVTAAAYTNSFPTTPATTQLFVIDSTNDRLFLQNPPNNGVLQDRGPLGFNVDAVNGFDIVGATDAYAVLTVAGVPGLYRIDISSPVSTARATLIGTPGIVGMVKGLAIPPAAIAPTVPTLYALVTITGTDTLVRFTANGGTPAVIGAISGLVSGESLVGIDFRPNGGLLYGVTTAGKVVTIDIGTGATTAAANLSADPADTADGNAPFSVLSGSQFGVDFNPVPDRLRVVSNSGLNLRVNVGSGATFTDGTLIRPPQIAAAAYTNSFAASTATMLYVIDANSVGLSLQNPPNDGLLTSVNSFGVSLADANVIGFDIAGGANGFALASLMPTGATQSSLYTIALSSGVATLVGPIGATGASPLRALAIQIR